jgi:hypothetical protein
MMNFTSGKLRFDMLFSACPLSTEILFSRIGLTGASKAVLLRSKESKRNATGFASSHLALCSSSSPYAF